MCFVFVCVVRICSVFCIWLCKYLQHMCCLSDDEDVFFICWSFFCLHVFSEVAALSTTVTF